MKTSSHFKSSLIAAGAVGIALIALSGARFTAALPGDVILGTAAALAVIGLAIHDYSRRARPLALPARVLRPALPRSEAPRAKAYGVAQPRKDRVAA